MSTAPGLAAAPLGAALRGGVFHYIRSLINGPRAVREVGAALAATPGERVLDLGCGAGGLSTVVPGDYLGIDLNPAYLAFARRRFELRELSELEGRETSDKAIMASVLHRLTDEQALAVLAMLARIVRRRLVMLDLDPESANGFHALLIRHDRGKFPRPMAAQRALFQ